MKRRISMIGMAAAMLTGGVLLTALPAAANDPPVEGECPPLTVRDPPGIDHLPDVAVRNILVACKRIGG